MWPALWNHWQVLKSSINLLCRVPGGAVAELQDVGGAVVLQLPFSGAGVATATAAVAGVVNLENLARRQRRGIDAHVVDFAVEGVIIAGTVIRRRANGEVPPGVRDLIQRTRFVRSSPSFPPYIRPRRYTRY